MSPKTVDIHVVDLDVSAAEVFACRALLDEVEISRADRFLSDSLSRRWTVCRARLRQILARQLALSPSAVRFATIGNGKPILDGASEDVHFNLSHSRDLAVVAVTRVGPVGVDVEFERTVADWQGVAARYFSVAERKQLQDVHENHRRHAFYCCWTRKEAVIKATGEGLSARLDAFDVSVSTGNDCRLLAWRGSDGAARDWHVHHLQPRPGYVGAVAILSPGPVRFRLKSAGNPGAR